MCVFLANKLSCTHARAHARERHGRISFRSMAAAAPQDGLSQQHGHGQTCSIMSRMVSHGPGRMETVQKSRWPPTIFFAHECEMESIVGGKGGKECSMKQKRPPGGFFLFFSRGFGRKEHDNHGCRFGYSCPNMPATKNSPQALLHFRSGSLCVFFP